MIWWLFCYVVSRMIKVPGWTVVVTQRLSINCRMTSLTMNSGYRFESMQSSGMRQLTTEQSSEVQSNNR